MEQRMEALSFSYPRSPPVPEQDAIVFFAPNREQTRSGGSGLPAAH
jgi:hypothetical protein